MPPQSTAVIDYTSISVVFRALRDAARRGPPGKSKGGMTGAERTMPPLRAWLVLSPLGAALAKETDVLPRFIGP